MKIDELAATVVALEQRIAALEAQGATPARKVAAPAPVEEGSRIVVGDEAVRAYSGQSAIKLPTDAEFLRLRAIVNSRCPALEYKPSGRFADSDAREDREGFKTAFVYIATTLARTNKLATKYAASWWIDGAEIWAREAAAGYSSTVPGRAFLAAVLAHGDVSYSAIEDGPLFGLEVGGHGRRFSDRWREVLETGRVLQPVAKPGPPPAARSPAQILIVGSTPGQWQ